MRFPGSDGPFTPQSYISAANGLGLSAHPGQATNSKKTSALGPKKKRSFFDKGGGFWDVLGVLGDGLSGDHDYANMVLQQRQAEQDEERYQRRRQEQNDDWLRRWRSERDYPNY